MMFKSKCCNADVTFALSPDFVGDDPKKIQVGTCSFECEKCGKPCDADIDSTLVAKDKTENEWLLTIERLSNGYLLRSEPEGEEWVIEDDEKDELKSHESLLWEVINHFNFGGSKHDRIRLKVTRIKQKG